MSASSSRPSDKIWGTKPSVPAVYQFPSNLSAFVLSVTGELILFVRYTTTSLRSGSIMARVPVQP